MSRPIVALLSDFGVRDHYTGVMKGVILGICPDAALVDISHDIPSHNIQVAALELAAAYRFFPSGSVFLVVVDPGVGSSRRGLAADAGDYRFVAPDNGVLTEIFREIQPTHVVELTERRYARPTISRTFEGRDRFAPAAAWLACGIQLSALGQQINDYQTIDIPVAKIRSKSIIGEVIRVDRFGNLITNIDRKLFEQFSQSKNVQFIAGEHQIGRLVRTYVDISDGETCPLFGSTDQLEIAANGSSAKEHLGLDLGTKIVIRRS